MWGTCLGHKMARFCLFLLYLCSTCLKCFKFLLKSCERPTEEYPVMLNYWDHVGAMFGPFWTMFGLAILPDQLELWNFQDLVNMVLGSFYGVCTFWDHIRVILGPFWYHVWSSFISQPARALKFWGLSQYGIKDISRKYPFFWFISGPFLDHVGTMFVLILYPDQQEL